MIAAYNTVIIDGVRSDTIGSLIGRCKDLLDFIELLIGRLIRL